MLTSPIGKQITAIVEAAEDRYHDVLMRLAAGEPLPAEEIQEACRAFAKTHRQLRADVATIEERTKAAEVLADPTAPMPEKRAAANSLRKTANPHLDEEAARLRYERSRIATGLDHARKSDPAGIEREMASVREQLQALTLPWQQSQACDLSNRLRGLELRLKSAEQSAAGVSELEQELLALDAEIDRLERARLVPGNLRWAS